MSTASLATPKQSGKSQTAVGFSHWMERVIHEWHRASADLAPDPVHDLRVALRRCRSMADGLIAISSDRSFKDMKKAGKKYDPVTYEGAGHGFMRLGEDPGDRNPANKKAHDEAWKRWKDILKGI